MRSQSARALRQPAGSRGPTRGMGLMAFRGVLEDGAVSGRKCERRFIGRTVILVLPDADSGARPEDGSLSKT